MPSISHTIPANLSISVKTKEFYTKKKKKKKLNVSKGVILVAEAAMVSPASVNTLNSERNF